MEFVYPQSLRPGDTVAVVSPSSQLASRFPAPLELGLRRLREEFGLVPREYPTTRASTASPAERARDLHAAFTDPDVAAVIPAIGGIDELKVLARLDPDLLRAHPKRTFGYSDNTNLHLFLWSLGIAGFHGGAVMVQFGRAGRIHPITAESLRRALFDPGVYELRPAPECQDEEVDWEQPGALEREPPSTPSDGWSWHGAQTTVSGRGWGGSLEIVDFHLRAGRYLLPDESYDGAILFLETSEELPDAEYVARVLMCMGERGLLSRFAGVLWGRPKAWSHEHRHGLEQRRAYIEAQRAAVLEAFAEYAPATPVVFGVELGHTEPQHVIPSGGEITIDAVQRRVLVRY